MTIKICFVSRSLCLFMFLTTVSGDWIIDHRNDLAGEEYPTMYCFQCNSGLDRDCANILPNDTSSYHFQPCLDTHLYEGKQPFCRKIVQKIYPRDNMERVIRKCGWVRHPRLDCYTVKNEDHEETICQCFDIGCNGSPALLSSLFIFVFTFLLQLFFTC